MSVDFSKVSITDNDGVVHKGVMPSSVTARPIRMVRIDFPEAPSACPLLPPECSPKDVEGFEVYVSVILEDGQETHLYKIVTLMSDGRKWAALWDVLGGFKGENWV